jgi:acyl-CoA thioesterase I
MKGREKHVFLFILIAVAVAAAILIRGEPTQDVVNFPSQNSGIVAFGDSLVKGVGSESGGFVALLSQSLGVPIANLGLSGDTTESALQRVGQVAERKPALTLILLGGNDFVRRVPHEETIKNLEHIITAIQATGSVVILIGLDAGLLGKDEGKIFENLSIKYRTAYVPDILDGIYGNRKLMSDLLHPNDSGYALMAERIEPVLSKLIK